MYPFRSLKILNSQLPVLLLIILICSTKFQPIYSQGYYYFNGKYYTSGNHQRNMQEYESKKEKYCSTDSFYKLLAIEKDDLHDIQSDNDYDAFFKGEYKSNADVENERKAKQNSKVLKSAWKKIALKMHPDKNPGDKFAEDKFTEVQLAYETLKEPKSKLEYDKIYKSFCNSEKFKRVREEKYRTRKSIKYEITSFSEAIKVFLDFTNYRIDLDIRESKDIDPLEKIHIEVYRKIVDSLVAKVPYNSLLALILHIFTNFMYSFWIYRTFGNMANILIMAKEIAEKSN